MRNFVIILALFCGTSSVLGIQTEASKFAENQYKTKNCYDQVKINVKKEYTIDYQQQIGDNIVPAITYGYGDMKVKYRQKPDKNCSLSKHKYRITYIVLLNNCCKPVWSDIFLSN